MAQVRAPEVFNQIFAQAGVDAVAFGLAVPPESVAQTCRGLLASPNVGGLLVTVPYKKVQVPAYLEFFGLQALAGRVNVGEDAIDLR